MTKHKFFWWVPRLRWHQNHSFTLPDIHISHISMSAYYHPNNIAEVWCFLSQSDSEKLVHAFISNRLVDCNALFAEQTKQVLNNPQLIQNAAASRGVRRNDYLYLYLFSGKIIWVWIWEKSGHGSNQKCFFYRWIFNHKEIKNAWTPTY